MVWNFWHLLISISIQSALSCCKVNYHKSNPTTHHPDCRVTAHEHQGQELQPLQSENELVKEGAVDDQRNGNSKVQ